MPVAETAVVTASCSVATTLIASFRFVAKYVGTLDEIKQFEICIENFARSTNTAKSLRSAYSHCLDHDTKADIDRTVDGSEELFRAIGSKIDQCRADLQTKNGVRMQNKMKWRLSGHDSVLQQVQLSQGLVSTLNRHIQFLQSFQPSLPPRPDQPPPGYEDSLYPNQQLRAPSLRRHRSRQENQSSSSISIHSNISSYSFHAEKEVPFEAQTDPPHPSALQNEENRHKAQDLERETTSPLFDSDVKCTGDYCTDPWGTNHHCLLPKASSPRAQSPKSNSLDGDSEPQISSPGTRTTTEPRLSADHTARPTSQRRRIKSGYV